MKICKLVEPKHIVAVVADEPDNRILECSEEANAEFIITEDRALLLVKEHAGGKLVRAADFLAAGLRR
jgi:predicted nucleic acid-binding protein